MKYNTIIFCPFFKFVKQFHKFWKIYFVLTSINDDGEGGRLDRRWFFGRRLQRRHRLDRPSPGPLNFRLVRQPVRVSKDMHPGISGTAKTGDPIRYNLCWNWAWLVVTVINWNPKLDVSFGPMREKGASFMPFSVILAWSRDKSVRILFHHWILF